MPESFGIRLDREEDRGRLYATLFSCTDSPKVSSIAENTR